MKVVTYQYVMVTSLQTGMIDYISITPKYKMIVIFTIKNGGSND
ncbi:hypothetical protein MTBBW1_620041 [Desulfamplus magnetovallimortis]|uniref:Uncharacterized protein n=1 Tax=Desulfamplus magnetovallimortis TaxID=1246637 RepID=A0A1W1HIW3_9BACT|nr:hypothetical protein MTBBW1_620041 [Desulfamplus magnetovallimortis]